jgi:hypothetical protein
MQCSHSVGAQGSLRRGYANRSSEKDEAYRKEETGKFWLQPHLIVHIEDIKYLKKI